MSHHTPFKSLCPTEWDAVTKDGLPDLLRATFSDAQTLIDSIPLPQDAADAAHGRPRAETDPSGGARTAASLNKALYPGGGGGTGGCSQAAKQLHKEWREVKTNPRDNPLAINVYKLAAKDGKGSWFARRSVHEGVPFDKFRLGLKREFDEGLRARASKPDAGPGAAGVRGIGTERRVERTTVEGIGKLEVYRLSAQFPGPTAPRDFVTLVLTSTPEPPFEEKKNYKCPPRQGYIRGQYESVEIIREIPADVPLRRVRSSIDLDRDEAGDFRRAERAALGRNAIVRSARKATGRAAEDDDGGEDARSTRSDVGTIKDVDADMGVGEKIEVAVEWLMITRSDPGGSVPRFMVEKGTPSSVVGDAGRLLDWLASKRLEDLVEEAEVDNANTEAAERTMGVSEEKPQQQEEDRAIATAEAEVGLQPEAPIQNLVPDPYAQAEETPAVAPGGGLYSMITGAIGVAGSMVASRIPGRFDGPLKATDSDPDLGRSRDDDTDSDASTTSSVRTFSSAMQTPEQSVEDSPTFDSQSAVTGEAKTETLRKAPSSHSMESRESESSAAPSRAALQHEKDLKKLQERRKKVNDKIAKVQERSLAKRQEDRDKDEQAMQKLREKHECEIACQEEKYRRELKKLEARRDHEERKAAERRRKQMEREEKANLALGLDRARTERDLALKQLGILKDQIGELQSQNTMLLAALGKHGLLKGGGIDALTTLQRSASSASTKPAGPAKN